MNPTDAKHFLLRILICILLPTAVLFGGAYTYASWFGVSAMLRRGAGLESPVAAAAGDVRLPSAMQTALAGPPPIAGSYAWQAVAPGLDTAELPVLEGAQEVDRILLTRLDPRRYRIEVHNAPAGDKDLDDWMKTPGIVFAINGSYYGSSGEPATPLLSAGRLLGPRQYPAKNGAFVAAGGTARITDLRERTWNDAFAGAHDGLVSYPLLMAGGRAVDVKATNWLANRSFVAEDGQGRIVFGTTVNAYFTLHRLAGFLAASPLGLASALNLDGGPVACQAVEINDFHRNFCGEWELQASKGDIRLPQPPLGYRRWALPIVISARRG